jgi:hypothetical protein
MESSSIYTITITLCWEYTRKLQFYHITDKAENNQRIKRNEEMCVCLDAGWCSVNTFKWLENV